MFHARAAICACGVLIWCGTAWAEVRALDAFVESQVQQNFAGIINIDRAFEALIQTTPNLPMRVRAHLERFDANMFSLSNATSTCIFSDPRSSLAENPKEFALDAVMFSFDPVITYGGSSRSGETRTIAFTESEIGAANGTELLVTSHLYLDGFMAVWGDLSTSAHPSSATVHVRIEQLRPLNLLPTVVLETTITLTHDNAGMPILTADGAVVVDNLLPPDDKLGTIFPVGVTYFARIPQLSIPYVYTAFVGEEFTLKAQIQGRVANQPFTGAGVSIGKPFDDFVTAIFNTMNMPITNPSIILMAKSMDRQPAKSLASGEGTQFEIVGTRGLLSGFGLPMCGGLGMEAMLLAAAFPAMMWAGRRRIQNR